MTPHIKYTKIHKDARMPVHATENSTGLDLFSVEEVRLDIAEVKVIKTGLKLDLSHLPATADVQIRPRSGMAANHGITVLNSPGTIDRDYRGELKVILINHGDFPYQIRVGEKIAQLVIGQRLPNVMWFLVSEVAEDTGRGAGGFGSTGK